MRNSTPFPLRRLAYPPTHPPTYLPADDHYDWYTWPRALRALTSTSTTIGDDDDDEDGEDDNGDGGEIVAKMSSNSNNNSNNNSSNNDHPNSASLRLALHTIASVLAAAAAARRVPRKWGGVFGQETMMGQEGVLASMTRASARAGYAEAQELGDWGQGLGVDVMDRKVGGLTLTVTATAAPTAASGEQSLPSLPPLPITLIGGALGSGKTSLVKHLVVSLTQRQQCKHIAVVVNTTAEINPGR